MNAHGEKLVNLFITDKKQRKKIFEKSLFLPRINLDARQLCDLELLVNGGFSPLDGFMNQDDYETVVSKMRLKNGILWPIPIVLDVPNIKNYKLGQEVLLCDEYGKPLSLFIISSIYKPNKEREAKKVYGTTDIAHFGVSQLLNSTGKYYLGGEIKAIDTVDRYDFTNYRYTPQELRNIFKEKKWKRIIGFQTRNPLHKAHYSMIKIAAEQYDAHVLLHPTVGMTKEGDIDYITRTKCYDILYRKYINDFTFLSLLPLAMRMGGPREALLHAIIRRNYGCTHFIIGRDHASPGKDKKGIPFYKPYDAQALVKKYATEIGIEPIFFKEMVYVEELQQYLPINKVKKNKTIKTISGSEFRRMIIQNKEIPEWFSFPEIIAEIKKSWAKEKKGGLTIFFTGLPSSGKSTIARYLQFRLLEIQNKHVTLLDGDVIRQNLSYGLGFSKKDRNINIARIGFVANEITKNGGIAICAAVAPYAQARRKNRMLISKSGTFVEIYISTPASICEKRDVKGLYKMARLGKINDFTGVNDPYEIPKSPDIALSTQTRSPQQSVNYIINFLQEKKLISLSD